MNEDDIKNTLDEFKSKCNEIINIRTENKFIEHNYIEVAGYPSFENVITNLLAFYFDVNEEHNLGDLFVRSLLEVYYEKTTHKEVLNYEMYTNPIREYSTKNGNRLDLLLLGNYVIGIENKIYAGLHNDLNDYYETITSSIAVTNNNKIIEYVPVVLSLYPVEIENKYKYKFTNITYDEFIERIKSNIGFSLIEGNNKWLLYFKEFCININSIKGDNNMGINKEYNQFVKNNNDLMLHFDNLYNEDIKNKREFLITLQNEIKKYRFSMYESQQNNGKSIYYRLDNNNHIKIECTPKLNILYVALWPERKQDNIDVIINKIKDNEKLQVMSNENNEGWWDNSYMLYKFDFSEDISSTDVAKKIEEICDIVKSCF